MGGNLPWNLVFAGVAIAIVVEILGIPVLPFAVGLYLPIHLSTPMMVGGAIRWYFERRGDENKAGIDAGILYSSGLIAGEGIVGILLAVFAIIPMGEDNFGVFLGNLLPFDLGNWGGLIVFALLCATLVRVIAVRKKNR